MMRARLYQPGHKLYHTTEECIPTMSCSDMVKWAMNKYGNKNISMIYIDKDERTPTGVFKKVQYEYRIYHRSNGTFNFRLTETIR